jgi:hypothetical protein
MMMNNFLTKAGLTLSLALSLGASAAVAKPKKPKHSAEHVAAVKKCNDDYAAAKAAASKLKGKEKANALAKAKADHAQCLKNAPNP